MKVKTTRFGEVEVNENLCFDMVSPILGYEDQKKFFLIEHKQQSNFRWLQSADSPDLAFVITMPGLFGIDYSFELPENIQQDLAIEDADDILSFNIVVIPHENPQASTINLVAPLIFNIKNQKGAQIVLTGTKLKVDTLLFKKRGFMLVLSRKNGQKIIINDNIEITILESKFDICKIAINAPRDVTIYREEVYKQIQLSNKMSNKVSVDAIDSLNSLVNQNNAIQETSNKIIIKKKES